MPMWGFVEWNTIESLTGLLIISTAIKESALFNRISLRMIKHFRTERVLGIFLVTLSAVFSMFLTNDITLFIVVPLTLNLQKFLKNDVSKMVIFEALAVNVGSMLSPIGNPQNLFLWHIWEISFFKFISLLFLLEIITFGILVMLTFCTFKRKHLVLEKEGLSYKIDTKLAIISVIFLALYVLFIQFKTEKFAVVPIFLFYLLFNKDILKKVDWFLLMIFILMFLDIQFLTQINLIGMLIENMGPFTPERTFLFSLISSQLMSNVPAAIFMSKFSSSYLAITYGVNIGGNGIVIGSLANIIALRMSKKKGAYLTFHKYSLPFFAITALVGYYMIGLFT